MEFECAGARVLVTGGAGFIGSCLVRRLVSLGAVLTVVDDFPTPTETGLPALVTKRKLRLPSSEFRDIVVAGNFDVVFHLAGSSYVPPSLEDPVADLRNNAEVTLQVLEAVRRHLPTARLIYTSSAAVYGNPEKLPISEDDLPAPISPYGVSKLAAETYVSLYATLFGLRTASLRPFSVYGPGQRKQVVFDLIAKVRANPREVDVYGTGDEMRDFIYVEDLVTALLQVASKGGLKGETYNAASGEGTTIHQLVETIASVLGARPHVRYSGQVRPGDALRWLADTSRLKTLGFRSSVTLKQGIREVVGWSEKKAPGER